MSGHYADAFAVRKGCFRMVSRDREGGPMHCPVPPTWVGTFRDREGRAYVVRTCDGHRGGLERARRIMPNAAC